MKRFALFFGVTMVCVPVVADQPPARPPITGIAEVLLSGKDLEQLFHFYSGVLSFAAAPTVGYCLGSEYCLVVNDHQRIELTQAGTPPRESMLELVVFETTNVDQLRLYLASHGISVYKAPAIAQAGKWIRVNDPDGHSIAFVQRPRMPHFVAREGQASLNLIHAGFVVRDRAAEDHFYKDILGFRPYWHGGMKDDKDDWVAMQVPDGTDWLEYMLNVSPNPDKHTLGVMNHMSLGVSDIHAAEQQLIKNGWKPGEKPQMGRDGKWQLNLYDPDVTRVEFMEFTPVQKPCCSEFTGPHPGSKQ